MVRHIVMWKLYDSAEGRDKQENALRMKQWLEDLKIQIPEIQKLEVGINFTRTDDAYDIALYAEFENRAALEIYQNHPDHKKFKQKINNIRSKKIVVDYEN